jgi:hypothetical protein
MTDTLLDEATWALSDLVLGWFALFRLVALGIGATLFWVYPDSAEIRKIACQQGVKRFCLMDDPPRLPGQRIAPRPD